MKKKIITFLSILLYIIGIGNVAFADVIDISPFMTVSVLAILLLFIPAAAFFIIDISIIFIDAFSKREVNFKGISKISLIISYILAIALILLIERTLILPIIGLFWILATTYAKIEYSAEKYKKATVILAISQAIIFILLIAGILYIY